MSVRQRTVFSLFTLSPRARSEASEVTSPFLAADHVDKARTGISAGGGGAARAVSSIPGFFVEIVHVHDSCIRARAGSSPPPATTQRPIVGKVQVMSRSRPASGSTDPALLPWSLSEFQVNRPLPLLFKMPHNLFRCYMCSRVVCLWPLACRLLRSCSGPPLVVCSRPDDELMTLFTC